ncbi:UNVERIFIED_CONTAM: hypothetical protein Sangu_0647800 [Sesamum angustifolium]|uniref:Organ specific protein n=1 Tax=Sesamum angustifolium TaxID=2727405 RepID=A0AAW2QCF6_9LAMI
MMKSLFILAALFSLALVSNGRKDPGEYWQGGMKDGPIQGLVDVSKVTSVSTTKNHCHTPAQESKRFVPTPHISSHNYHNNDGKLKAINSTPNISAYDDNVDRSKGEKSFKKDFEPRPNISTYGDDDKVDGKKSFVKDFEPRPNISTYTDDDKVDEKKSFIKDFEPRPNISAYGDDDKVGEKKSFVKNFEPRANISAYTDDDKTDGEKSFIKDFEPIPNISVYNDDSVGEEAKQDSEERFGG